MKGKRNIRGTWNATLRMPQDISRTKNSPGKCKLLLLWRAQRPSSSSPFLFNKKSSFQKFLSLASKLNKFNAFNFIDSSSKTTGNADMELQVQIKRLWVGDNQKRREKFVCFHYLPAKTESYLRATIIHFPREKHEIESLCDTLADDKKSQQLALRLLVLCLIIYIPLRKIVQNLSLSKVFVVEMRSIVMQAARGYFACFGNCSRRRWGDELHLIWDVNIMKASKLSIMIERVTWSGQIQ